MVKYVLFLLVITITANALTYRDFTEARQKCLGTIELQQKCTFKPINR